jgi:hypothetical protein
VFDPLADLCGDELHALREISGKRLGFVAGRFAQR